MTKLAQAIRNVIELEMGAARFYDKLVAKVSDPAVCEFLEKMAHQERQHAEAIQGMAIRFEAGELPHQADSSKTSRIETAPGWGDGENVTLEQAIDLAIEAENSAALYYDAMSDFFEGEGLQFFQKMVACEEQHAENLRALKAGQPPARATGKL